MTINLIARHLLPSLLIAPALCLGAVHSRTLAAEGDMARSTPWQSDATRSLTDSGYQVQLKRIADIKIGDEVLALDELKAHDQQSHAQRYEKVTDIVSSEKQQRLVHLTLDNGQTLSATQGHPFKTEEGWRDAILLKKGGKLLLKGGESDADASDANGVTTAPRYATITDVSIEQKITPVFNLEVAQLHTFFVGVDGVVVHNAKSGTSGNNSHAAQGKKYDKEDYPTGYKSQRDIGGGMRVDGINYATGHIIERKCTGRWQTVRNGQKRSQDYVNQMNETYPRPGGWTADIHVRNPFTGVDSIVPAVR